MFAIIGGGCSNATLAARPEIEKAGVPFHVFAAVADGIVDPPATNIYTTQITASVESRAQIQWALDHGAKKLAIVAQHDAWGRSRYEPMLEDFKQRGVKVVADEEVTVDQNDGTAQALRLKAAGADAVMLLGYPKAAAVLIRDFNQDWLQAVVGRSDCNPGPAGIAKLDRHRRSAFGFR